MRKSICFIGNDSDSIDAIDGQTLKIRLYKRIFEKENVKFEFINLYKWKRHFISLLIKIAKGIRNNDIILLMAGPRGARLLIPLINKLNRHKNKRFVCSMIGRGTLSIPVDSNKIDSNEFFLNHNFHGIKDEKIRKNLKKVDAVILETDIIKNTYSLFYSLNNCFTIPNFRALSLKKANINKTSALKLGYFSRVCRYKGIFDLLEAFKRIKTRNLDMHLDIYGNTEFNSDDELLFRSYINNVKDIDFHGPKTNYDVLKAMTKTDCFVFPSICSEGMPGAVIESLVIGLPLISSTFTQSKEILTDGFDSLLYEAGNVDQLINCLTKIYEDRNFLEKMSNNALISGKKFTYEYNKNNLFSLLGL